MLSSGYIVVIIAAAVTPLIDGLKLMCPVGQHAALNSRCDCETYLKTWRVGLFLNLLELRTRVSKRSHLSHCQ